MDPIAKRFMWEVISRLSTRQGKTAVILTTHSMNEAQALCTRIGIMVPIHSVLHKLQKPGNDH
jgi:ATP-binding cassette subfamily A (ABC1) protein 3